MSTAQRFLHADSAGGFAPTPRLMYPIAQRLKSLTILKAQPKALLVEVCELHENGGKGCYISNAGLAGKLGISLATATRTVALLVESGLLTSHVVKAEANRRYLAPTAAVRACYAAPTAAAQLLAVSNLTIVKKEPAPVLTIVKSESDYSQNCEVTIVKNETDYSQSASRVLGDNQYNHSYNQEEEKEGPLRSALSAAEKKIAELESQLEEMTYQRNQLRNSLAAVRPASSAASASHTGGAAASLHKFPFSQSRVATPEGFVTLATALKYPAAYAPHYLAHMAVAAGDETRDEKGWQNFVRRFLDNDAHSKTGLITTPPNDSAHVNQHSTFTQQRPASGAKPTGAGGQLARSLAERRKGQ